MKPHDPHPHAPHAPNASDAEDGALLDEEIDGAVNLRPVAPLPARGGRLRPRTLFRSGMTSRIAPAGLARLARDHGLRTVIDLRTTWEVERQGVASFAEHDIAHHHTPMEDPADRDPASKAIRLERFRSGQWDWAEVYLRTARSSGESLRRALELCASAADVPILVHCFAGRDRTGITIAAILSVLGVDRQLIAADYARSGPALRVHVVRFFRPAPTPDKGLTHDELSRVLDTDANDLLRFLTALDGEWGGVDEYLDSIGAGRDLREALRARFIERG